MDTNQESTEPKQPNATQENWDSVQAALVVVKYHEDARLEAIDRQRRVENKSINLCVSIGIFISILSYVLTQRFNILPPEAPNHIINIILYIILLGLSFSWLLVLITTLTSQIGLNCLYRAGDNFDNMTKNKKSFLLYLRGHCQDLEDIVTLISISSRKKAKWLQISTVCLLCCISLFFLLLVFIGITHLILW